MRRIKGKVERIEKSSSLDFKFAGESRIDGSSNRRSSSCQVDTVTSHVPVAHFITPASSLNDLDSDVLEICNDEK